MAHLALSMIRRWGTAPTFDEAEPEPPVAKVPGFFDKLFSSRKLRIEEENRAAEQSFQESHADWQMKLDEFHTQVIARKNLVEVLIPAAPPVRRARQPAQLFRKYLCTPPAL